MNCEICKGWNIDQSSTMTIVVMGSEMSVCDHHGDHFDGNPISVQKSSEED